MVAEWYLKVAGKELGPLTAQQLKRMAGKGQLSPDDPVRQGSDGPWVSAARVKGLLPGAGSPAAQSNSNGMPVAKPLEEPPRKPKTRSRAGAKPAATPVAKPLAEPVASPAPTPPVAAPPRAAPTAVPPTAAPPANQFSIDTGAPSPAAVASGRGGPGAANPRKKRKTHTVVVVGLAVLLVGLGVAGAAMILSKTGIDEPAQDPDAVASQPATETGPANEAEPEEFDALGGLEEGLAELIGEPKTPGPKPERPVEAAADTPADTTPDESEWSDASTASVTRGDVTVKITAAETGRPRLVRAGSGLKARPKEDYLSIKLQLLSENATKKLDYTSWSVRIPAAPPVRLVDNFGNEYALKSFTSHGMEVEGQVSGGKGSIYPGKPTDDVLVFEPPIEKARFLRLELPAAAFGEQGTLRFEIPMTMVVAMAEAGEASEAGEPPSGDPVEPGTRPRTSDDEPLPPGRGVPAIDRGIDEVDREGEPGQPAPERPDDPGGIPGVIGAAADPGEDPDGVVDKINADIEALGGGDEDQGDEQFSFSDDPVLKKRSEQFRQQANPGGNRENKNRHRGGR